MTLQEAETATILRATVGSTVHGLHMQDGLEDTDEMGVCVEPLVGAFGLGHEFEQFIYRSAAEREGRHDAPSRAGDLDLTIYGLRKFCRLALKGNPTILTLLFAPDPLVITSVGAHLRELTPAFLSRRAGHAFLGYLQAQRQRLTGERGGLKVHRQHLVEQHGYDTKFAMHMCRLGLQGIELLSTGTITLPMPEPDRAFLLSMRRGEVDLQTALSAAKAYEEALRDLLKTSPLPDEPDTAQVETWMLRRYLESWKAHDWSQLPLEYPTLKG